MISYTHVNEDNRVERKVFEEHSYPNLFCIAGSGERLVGLLEVDLPCHVFAIDNNEEALFLLELKLAALRELDIADYLNFTGLLPAGACDRVLFFERMTPGLSPACRAFWRKKPEPLARGVANTGHFERFLRRVRPLLRLFLRKGFYGCFEKPLSESQDFPYRRWDLMKKIFSTRWVYRLMGNSDEAFIGRNADLAVIPNGLQTVLDKGWVDDSFMFHLIFKGHLGKMPEVNLPHSLRTGTLGKIKSGLASGQLEIEFVHADLLGFLKRMSENSYSGSFFSLSDLLSFADWQYLTAVFQEIRRVAPGSTVVFRSFVRNRLSPDHATALEKEFGPLEDHSAQEKTGMYQVFSLTLNQ